MAFDSLTSIANRTGYDTSFTNEYSTDQTAGTILTPTTGKLIKVAGVYFDTASTDGEIRIYLATSGNTIFHFYAASGKGPVYVPIYAQGARNEVIKLTSSFGGDDYYVQLNYSEE